jgi:hypothetical protein
LISFLFERNLTGPRNIPEGLKTRFEVRDFFSFRISDDQKFDLIYDYTSESYFFHNLRILTIFSTSFFVAIPPSRRLEWGSQINSLIKSGGYLITLIYPLEKKTDVGPPWFVRPEHYLEPLGEGWEKVVDRVPTTSSETHVGRERLVVWRKI